MAEGTGAVIVIQDQCYINSGLPSYSGDDAPRTYGCTTNHTRPQLSVQFFLARPYPPL